MKPELPFDKFESHRCHRSWKASCGPHSIAAACNIPLDGIRSHMPHLKGWMSPTNIEQVLKSLGFTFQHWRYLRMNKVKTPADGILRVQWEGEWLNPDRPPKEAYHHTHYVAARGGFVFDVALTNERWFTLAEWLPQIGEYSQLAPSQGWHFTDCWSVQPK